MRTHKPDELEIKEDIMPLNATNEIDLLFLNHLFKQLIQLQYWQKVSNEEKPNELSSYLGSCTLLCTRIYDNRIYQIT